jgi:nickel-dependent lactate racemase
VSIDFRYGTDCQIRLDDLPAAAQHCALPHGDSVADVAAAMQAALSQPIDFPPIGAAVLPGDSVAIAVDPQLPQLAAVVAALANNLVSDGAVPARMAIVLAAASDDPVQDDALQDDIRQALPADWADDVELVVHDPDSRQSLAYLGDTRAKHRVDLCRALFDADVLVSVGRLTPAGSFQSLGVHAALYPTFAGTKTQRRYRRLATVGSPRRFLRQARNELAEVARLAGAMFTVQIIPGRGDDILHIVAGAPSAVASDAEQLCRAAWETPLAARADLVIATIPDSSQTSCWDNLARGLASAARAATHEGALAICCQLDAPRGKGLATLAASENLREAAQQIRQDAPRDAALAMQLAHTLGRHDVYLLSGLAEEVVEQLGMTPLANGDELAKLARRFDSTTIIENAHLAVIKSCK